jgi:hypothetical protein
LIGTKIDRFTQVHRYFLDKFKNDTDLKALIPARNIVDFTNGETRPFKSQSAPNDFPAILFRPSGNQPRNFHYSSSGAQVIVRYELEVATNSQQLSDNEDHQKLLYPLMQHIDRVLFNITDKVTRDFHAMDYGFNIIRFECENVAIQELELGNEGNPGWIAVYSLYAELDISRDIIEVP